MVGLMVRGGLEAMNKVSLRDVVQYVQELSFRLGAYLTAIVENPASKDGVGSTEDCVSQYSADGQQTQERRTIVDPFIPDAHV
jgi:hypothetical protein